jgi:adenosylmethionine-8-amino-7-oxononanoate aminotransferase
MAMVRPQFLRAVQQRVRQAGALLIADEVMIGFGRSGNLFASQGAGLEPDLIALSKGLTGGFLPMGVTLAREKLYEAFVGEDPALTLFHGHSFTANPLGCAAALASLDLLEAHPERYAGMEARHRPHLEALAARTGVVRPRLLGSIAAVDIAQGPAGYLNPVGRQLRRSALAAGVVLRPLGQVVYLLPPLCITDEQLGHCYAAIASGLEQL